MKRIFLILSLFSLFLMGCSTTIPTKKTETIIVEQIGTSSKTVKVETIGNLTRIYSVKKEEK